MSNFLTRYWLKLHADARLVDASQTLLGAMGVAAFAYPHQIDTVERIATDTACRFLLADEVGLGKTVQAIMAMRALIYGREKGLKAALVVPDDLAEQWQMELLCRTQVGREGVVREPYVDTEDTEDEFVGPGGVWLDLCRAGLLTSGSVTLNAKRYDLLLVDEYSKLSQQVRDLVGQAGRSIPNLLLLTATPALHDERVRREIFSLLEPDIARTALAQEMDLLDLLQQREIEAEALISGDMSEPEQNQAEAGEARAYYRSTHSLFRRVIRTRRADYPEALPQRLYSPIVVPTTDGEAKRIAATRKFLALASSEGFQLKADRLLQVACRSPDSLASRLTTLRRPSSALAAAGREIEDATKDPGDAKLDALVDHLAATFHRQPDARVLVVVEDNPSVDYVSKAIEKLLPIKAAQMRRAARQSQAKIDVHVSELREVVEPFETGDARVLVAADVASEGHNFQFATEIVFYVLPWDPQAVDQWIGRLDRLGGNGPPGKRTVKITPIVSRQSIEAKILEVYEAAGIFSGGIVFDENDWRNLAEAIDSAAYGSEADWRRLVDEASSNRHREEGWRNLSTFPPENRRPGANNLFKVYRERRYALPLAGPSVGGGNWFKEREAGANRLLTMAKELEVLDLRQKTDAATKQKYATLGYHPLNGSHPHILIPEIDERPGTFQPLIFARANLTAPPTPKINGRRLHFFDHGNPLHGSVVSSFASLDIRTGLDREHVIQFDDGHPYSRLRGKHVVLLTGVLHPKLPNFDLRSIQEIGTAGESSAEREAMATFIRRAHEEYLADNRWFANLCEAKLFLLAGCNSNEGIKVLKSGPFIGSDLTDGSLPAVVSERTISDLPTQNKVKAIVASLEQTLSERSSGHLTELAAKLRAAVPLRRFKLLAESTETTNSFAHWARREQIRGGNLAPDHARRRAAKLAIELSEYAQDFRISRIDAALSGLSSAKLENKSFCVLRIQ